MNNTQMLEKRTGSIQGPHRANGPTGIRLW